VESRIGRNQVGISAARILDEKRVLSAWFANLGAADNIEEGSPKENLEWSVLDDLELEVNHDRPKSNRMVLDNANSKSRS